MTRYSRKKARTMRPSWLLPKWQRLQQTNQQKIQQDNLKKTSDLCAHPVEFCSSVLGFKPYSYQEQFIRLFEQNQFTAARTILWEPMTTSFGA